ncbi:MAG TPA: hypothetical protein VG455_10320 [Acidimicrobiales bacterium]|nr:hypothetical protein [Acidimicrobiales bacterium]
MADAERERLAEARPGKDARGNDRLWKRWGPYLAERAWGTVREDYGPDGNAWDYFPHDHARSRAYRWNEDGMCGISDNRQLLCLAMAFWNGRDPIVKERMYGLTNGEGTHGEDVKEHYWFLASTPTHSWMRWLYHYPQAAFPYVGILDGNGARDRLQPEFELLDTGVFDANRYWAITVDIAKETPEDLFLRVRVRNAGPDEDVLHVLPTLWFRNTWSWGPELQGQDGPFTPYRPSLSISSDGRGIVATHRDFGTPKVLEGDGAPALLFCENDSNRPRLGWGPPTTPFPKDGIVDHVRTGAATVNPARTGTKSALHYQLTVPAGGEREIRLRFADEKADGGDMGDTFDRVLADREREAEQFYAALTPEDAEGDEPQVLRQAFAGMLWSKQYYHYDVRRWLDGDLEAEPPSLPPPESRKNGRNREWRHVRNSDVISMPDTWEYPWYAAWDLAFHAVVLAHVDPDFAKEQLVLLCREGYQHPDGRLPAYEWAFGDINPPVHAWAAMRVFEIDGSQDFMFLELVLDKLRRNFRWWSEQRDADGNQLFEGGFLGLDNIGPFDRSNEVPAGKVLEQSDATAWMAMYCTNLLEMCFRLSRRYPVYEDLASEYFERFLEIARAMNSLWDEEDGFYYDVLRDRDGGAPVQLGVRSMVGLVALYAVTFLKPRTLAGMPRFAERFEWLKQSRPELFTLVSQAEEPRADENRLFSIVDRSRLERILSRVLDPNEFLSDFGVRSLSRAHRDHPFRDDRLPGARTVSYVPGESDTGDFGGNSNWRGPVWFPVNYLLIEALHRFHTVLGSEFKVDYPTGSGQPRTLDDVATDLSRRLVSLFLRTNGRRPVHGDRALLQDDPAWRDRLTFYEYFHGDTGSGLGASHQTGWTGLVADLINTRGKGGQSLRFPAR